MEIVNFVIEEALILIPVLMVIGKIVKSTPNVKDWAIPYILLVLGVVFSNALMGIGVDAFIQGILVSGASVFTHQLVKQVNRQ